MGRIRLIRMRRRYRAIQDILEALKNRMPRRMAVHDSRQEKMKDDVRMRS